MDQNKFNQVVKAVNTLNDFMIEGHIDYDKVGKKAKQLIQPNYRSSEQDSQPLRKVELNSKEKAYQEDQNKKRNKQKKNKSDKGNEEQIQSYRLHQQELGIEQDKIRKQEETNLDYWREAMLLSEIIGSPVAKRRRAKRMERR